MYPSITLPVILPPPEGVLPPPPPPPHAANMALASKPRTSVGRTFMGIPLWCSKEALNILKSKPTAEKVNTNIDYLGASNWAQHPKKLTDSFQ
jgi:hypothetical protein